jgi:hypothetical protein
MSSAPTPPLLVMTTTAMARRSEPDERAVAGAAVVPNDRIAYDVVAEPVEPDHHLPGLCPFRCANAMALSPLLVRE